MKKMILLSIISLFTTVAFSQEEQNLKLGARLNYQMQSPSEKELDMGFLGFGVGIKAGISINDNLSFAPGLNFLYRQLLTIENSYYDEWEDETNKTEADVSEFAISIPLMLEIKATEALYFAAGIQLDFPFSTEMNIDEDGDKVSVDISKERSSIDFGIPLGIGFFVNENIALDFRAVIALTDADEDDELGSFNQFGLGVTYFFQ